MTCISRPSVCPCSGGGSPGTAATWPASRDVDWLKTNAPWPRLWVCPERDSPSSGRASAPVLPSWTRPPGSGSRGQRTGSGARDPIVPGNCWYLSVRWWAGTSLLSVKAPGTKKRIRAFCQKWTLKTKQIRQITAFTFVFSLMWTRVIWAMLCMFFLIDSSFIGRLEYSAAIRDTHRSASGRCILKKIQVKKYTLKQHITAKQYTFIHNLWIQSIFHKLLIMSPTFAFSLVAVLRFHWIKARRCMPSHRSNLNTRLPAQTFSWDYTPPTIHRPTHPSWNLSLTPKRLLQKGKLRNTNRFYWLSYLELAPSQSIWFLLLCFVCDSATYWKWSV